ncbi:kinase-like domain-containing protein [Rhizophagus clarus]|uniref:Kinase-like domain-containing protein n=1 Tax=Rhizophagus clarus TaxID=94130 RepID=A0A8H3MD24_9GLOM|nr:kinase-like domain-containing protein [Rhizophagus clarus]
MFSLVDCYDGVGTEKNSEEAFYWYQKAAESSNKISFKNRLKVCNICKKPYTGYQWCQQCNSRQFQNDFPKWTSKNEFIDKFIQEAQLNAKNSYEVLEWIPYNKLSDISYHDKGGFSEIHRANWLDGPICSWNFNKQYWNRWNFQTGYKVILKTLNNSSSLKSDFLDEWKHHYNYLMKRCWDSNPSNRPTIIELEHKISEWVRSIGEYYRINRDGSYKIEVPNANNKLKNDIFEFVKANNTLSQEQATNISTTIVQSHSQAYYTSRKLTEISNCLDCMI